MKLFKIFAGIALVILLNSCALFSKKAKFTNLSCPEENFSEFTQIANQSFQKLKTCLQANKRDQDATALDQITNANTPITLRCEQKAKNISVVIDSKNSKTYPSFNLNLNSYKKSKEAFEKEFFHEAAHLLGYEHTQNFDLSEIAEMCCLPIEKTAAISKKSCEIFKYNNSQWTQSAYLKDFNESLIDFGNANLAIKTSLAAAVHHSKRKDYSSAQAAALSVIKPLSRIYAKTKLSRSQIRDLKKETGVVATLILSKLGFASQNNQDLLTSRQVYNQTKLNFYNTAIEDEKIQYFNDISETLNNLMLLKSQEFLKNWIRLRDRSLYLCRDLKENELNSLEAILNSYNSLIFTLKNDIPAGDFYEIATYWSKPCDLQKSYKSTASKD